MKRHLSLGVADCKVHRCMTSSKGYARCPPGCTAKVTRIKTTAHGLVVADSIKLLQLVDKNPGYGRQQA
jgi:hypothetical protein